LQGHGPWATRSGARIAVSGIALRNAWRSPTLTCK
jgi:hypothetical protein